MTKHLYHQKVLQKNLYLIEELKQSPIKIKLAELLIILLENTITLRDAARYLKDKYRRSEVPEWKNLSDQQIVQEARSCMKFKQQRQWMQQSEKAVRKESPERQRIQEYMKAKNIKIDERISRIKQLIQRCERQLKVCQEQQLFLQKKSQLFLMKKELKYLQPQNRLQGRLLSLEQEPEDLREQILESVNQVKQKYNQADTTASVQTISPIRIKLHKLKKLFNHYLIKCQKRKSTFQGLSETSTLPIKGFMDFVKDFKLGSELTANQIFDLFRLQSSDKKNIHFDDFIELLKSMHRAQCDKCGIYSNEFTQNQYIDENVVQSKIVDLVLHKKAYPQKLFNYEFKILPHSGKSKEEIMAQLISRKQKKLILEKQKKGNKSLSPQKATQIDNDQTKSIKLTQSVVSRFENKSMQFSPVTRRRSQPNIFSKQEFSQPIGESESIFNLFPTDQDPYLDGWNNKKSTVILPSLKRPQKYVP